MSIGLSVLTPSYNYDRFLMDNLESVRAQEPLLEHVVVDDGSTDASPQILAANGAPHLVYRAQANAGLSATLNACLDLCGGEWIGWLNADDFYLPWTSAVVSEFTRGPYDVIYGDSVFVDDNARVTRLSPQHKFSHRVLRGYGPFIAPPALFVRRSALGDFRFDCSLIKLMDWDLYLHLFAAGARFKYLPITLGAFRRHRQQQSNRVTPEAETARVRTRYGLPEKRSVTARCYYRYGELEHAIHKTVNGGYRRQAATSKVRGLDLRWWLPGSAPFRGVYQELLGKGASWRFTI